ncbi:MAG: hypothetical protein GX595_08400 [Lentisphaerae bacterium]|nr:hypothetical protein [Lentisphaerota bacterium]
MNRLTSVLLCVTCAAALWADDLPLGAFDYPDTAAARQRWQPQFGSRPVRVEALPDGTTCLALDADFPAAKARACWDWVAPMDLSSAARVAFEIAADNGAVVEMAMIYFGTAKGWYAHVLGGGVPGDWTGRSEPLSAFSAEGTPDGWDKVERLRVSVWSSAPGKATFRLRRLRVVAADPGENFLPNGSFEISGAGMPYAWGSGHWGVGELPWFADMDLWRRHWRLDDAAARHGTASLRIDNAPGQPLLQLTSAGFTPPPSAPRSVLSAWVRADRDGLPVTLRCGQHRAAVEAGTAWRQVALTGIVRAEHLRATIAPGAAGTLWIDAVQVQAGDEPTADFHPADLDPATATREAAVDWSPPARTAAVAAGRGAGEPLTAPARVRIDTEGRFLVDGRPYLQHSFGLEFVSHLDVLNAVAGYGFRDVCIQIRESLTTAQLTAIFDRCAAVGLRLIPWLDGRMSREQFTAHITALREHPALLCWYVYDEPSGSRFAEADARVHLAKELDPDHPAFVNYLPNRLENQTGDIYSTDVYPIPHGTPMAAIQAVSRMAAAAAPERKPVWMWLQGTGYAYWMAREPTPRELSCMAYGSILAGARGLYYFAQMPRTRQCLDEMRALCVEIDAIAPALGSPSAPPALTCSQPQVMAKAYATTEAVVVIAVNTTSRPCEARFTLASPAGGPAISVLFEDRDVRRDGGAWEDRFGTHERHVYRLSTAP